MRRKREGQQKPKQTNTSWGSVADWYGDYMEHTPDSYQRAVILPNLLRVLEIKKGMRVLDLACGQGFFSREMEKAGAAVVGVDIAKNLIDQAKTFPGNVEYHVAPANKLGFLKKESFDATVVVLAIQNIEDMVGTFAEAARVLRNGGRLILVMMHPAFRIPQRTSWGWDNEAAVQYRRIDSYLSSSRSTLLVHPGKKNSETTVSYHRSLQDFFKALSKTGFTVSRLEEWISHKESEKGPRQHAENKARKEIPMFLMLEARKG